jgi:hypothetical protein
MAIIWNDDRLTPERMLSILKKEREHWLETAEAFERLKTYLNGTFALQDAEERARNCRGRAESLAELIKTLEEEVGKSTFLPKPPTGFTQFMIQ